MAIPFVEATVAVIARHREARAWDDASIAAAILAQLGAVKLAVTTNLNINFLRKPGPADMIGEARLLKLGKRLAVGEVTMTSVGAAAIVAHATGTYSIPPRGETGAVL